jgi:hypothetical protein
MNDFRRSLDELIKVLPSNTSVVQASSGKRTEAQWINYFETVLRDSPLAKPLPDSRSFVAEKDLVSEIENYISCLLKPFFQHAREIIQNTPESDKFLLSVNELKAIYSALEVFWLFGIAPTVEVFSSYSVDSLKGPQSFPKAMLFTKDLFQELFSVQKKIIFPIEDLFEMVELFEFFIFHPVFVSFVLNRNMSRYLLSLFTFATLSKKATQSFPIPSQTISSKFDSLITSSYQALIINTLRGFTRAQEEIKNLAANLFHRILTSGVEGMRSVIIGYMEDVWDTPHCEAMQGQLARLIVSVPKEQKEDVKEYFQQISPNLLFLFKDAIQRKDQIFTETVVLILLRMIQFHPMIAEEFVLDTLFSSLIELGRREQNITNENNSSKKEISSKGNEQKNKISVLSSSSNNKNIENSKVNRDLEKPENESTVLISSERLSFLLTALRLLLLRFPVFSNLILCLHKTGIVRSLLILYYEMTNLLWIKKQENQLFTTKGTNWSSNELNEMIEKNESVHVISLLLMKILVNRLSATTTIVFVFSRNGFDEIIL